MQNELKNNFDKDGYVVLKNFFHPHDIDGVRNCAQSIFGIQIQKFYGEDIKFKDGMIKLFQEHEEVFKNCGKLIQTGLLPLYEMAVNEKLYDTLETLGLGFPNMCTRPVLFFNHPKLAKDKVYYKTPKHQDWPSIESSINSVVVWIPLVNVGLGNGSIILYPGSHKKGVLPHKINGGFAEVEYDDENAYQPTLGVGDIVIFSTLLVHESGEIFDDSIRWSASFRYTDMLSEEFINRGYVSPYSYLPTTKILK